MTSSRRAAGVAAALALFALVGCGSGGPPTHAVRGKVVVEGGDIKPLVGSSVELELESDPKVRASGPIHEDGSFELGMLHEGKSLVGALAGKYRARIVPGGEDEDLAKWAKRRPIHPRFEDFKTSGLTITVPPSGDITLKLSKK